MVKMIGNVSFVGALLILAVGSPSTVSAQQTRFEDVAQIKAVFEPQTARRGQTILLKINISLATGFHTYPTIQTDPNAASYHNDLAFGPTLDVVPVGELREPPFLAKPLFDLQITDLHFYTGENEWVRPVVVNPQATPGSKTVELKLPVVQVCNEQTCLPTMPQKVKTALTITDEPPVDVERKYQADVEKGLKTLANPPNKGGPQKKPDANPSPDPSNPESSKETPKNPSTTTTAKIGEAGLLNYATTEDYRKSLDELRPRIVYDDKAPTDLLAFILQGVFWGVVSLVTPCVFPMIPITVSFFLKQSEKQHHRPLAMASVYCGTIVVVLALAALLLLNTFRVLSINPILNFAMGGLFIFFALSLFGMYEIELPSGLARFTSSHEGKGGVVGTIFMALTFTILSFACVAPFLGAFGGTANLGLSWWEQALGALAYSITFAAPFFVLALFPSLLKKMPKSGTWLNSVKVVMGFLELAAAFKFLRLGEIVIHPPTIFTYDVVLGIWIALCLLCGLYLLSVFRLPHDTPVEHIGVPRLLLAALFLGAGVYLIPALFKLNGDGEVQRPGGVLYAWVDSFILPDAPPAHAKGELPWQGDLRQAVDELVELRKRTEQRRFIFIDTTGKTCVNCKINERAVFSKPQFKDLFSRYKLVKFYTDEIPADFYAPSLRASLADSDRQSKDALEVNFPFQTQAFHDDKLPLYVIWEPLADGRIKVVGQYAEGKINDESAFAKFLTDPFDPAAATAGAK